MEPRGRPEIKRVAIVAGLACLAVSGAATASPLFDPDADLNGALTNARAAAAKWSHAPSPKDPPLTGYVHSVLKRGDIEGLLVLQYSPDGVAKG
jgi:hypothetical protein